VKRQRRPLVASHIRPPRQVWFVLSDGELIAWTKTRKAAKMEVDDCGDGIVVGPYVLAERVRQR
jgi:hypothetical protein